ncbi:hypothetical protein ABGB12_11995 [Actinocorallia sp. B10E7]|uniref:hypothetical protein n=1 Tax=Actinocorallia sp. B10E7 TaxID=3153558 RepID=UPI00325CB184
MRVRLACAAATLGIVGSVPVGTSGASAGTGEVEPGVYQIATPEGQCLGGTGEKDVSLWLGPCERSGWQVEATEGGYVIKHAVTGGCLAPSVLRIYPQRVGVRDCGDLDERWAITGLGSEDGREQVRITRPDYYSSLSWLSDKEPVFLLPQSQTGNQRWVLKRL